MKRYRILLSALFSLFLVLVGVAISWSAAWVTYWKWSDGGSIYLSSKNESGQGASLRNVNISGWDNLYTRDYNPRAGRVSYKVFVSNQFICEIYASFDPKQGVDGESQEIAWRYGGGDTKENMLTLFGVNGEGGSAEIYSLSHGPWFTPFTRGVWVGIPSGSVGPVVNKAINDGIIASGLSIEDKYLKAFSTRIAQEIRNDLDIDTSYQRIDRYISSYGPVQYATLWLFYFFCYLIVVSFWFEWGKLAAEMASGLIPFVGFFGTLLGMSGALGILGSTDLSDPVSKSINLGPIGSELGFAIRTTIFAFIFYAISFLIYVVRIAVYENETYIALNKSGSWMSRRVMRAYRLAVGLRRKKMRGTPE